MGASINSHLIQLIKSANKTKNGFETAKWNVFDIQIPFICSVVEMWKENINTFGKLLRISCE